MLVQSPPRSERLTRRVDVTLLARDWRILELLAGEWAQAHGVRDQRSDVHAFFEEVLGHVADGLRRDGRYETDFVQRLAGSTDGGAFDVFDRARRRVAEAGLL